MKDYLNTLHSSKKWLKETLYLQTGDLVLITDCQLYSKVTTMSSWPLARVIFPILEMDESARSARVKTDLGEFVLVVDKMRKLPRYFIDLNKPFSLFKGAVDVPPTRQNIIFG